jgi:hypothetical protein
MAASLSTLPSGKEIAGVAEVLIISGAGCYSDPWHQFGNTSQRLAESSPGSVMA